MKYICFGYLDTQMWSKLSPSEQAKMMDDCFTYDEKLQKSGHWAGGEGLQGPETATTLRYQNGKVTMTDGPYVETKEMLGGILFLEAKDLNQALQLLSNHPGAKMGPWEIRPVADMAPIIAESKKRRGVK
jgi:hypothetical protein